MKNEFSDDEKTELRLPLHAERLSFIRCIITKRRVRTLRVVMIYVLEATKAYILLVCLY